MPHFKSKILKTLLPHKNIPLFVYFCYEITNAKFCVGFNAIECQNIYHFSCNKESIYTVSHPLITAESVLVSYLPLSAKSFSSIGLWLQMQCNLQ